MIDVQRVEEGLENVCRRLARRLPNPAVLDQVLGLAGDRRTLLRQIEEGQKERKLLAQRIGAMSGAPQAASLKEEARRLNDRVQELQAGLAGCEGELHGLLLAVPNLPHPTVPDGADHRANVQVRRWGEPRLPIAEPRPHWEVGEGLGLDIERGTRLSGSRFYVLKGDLALLELALTRFMVDLHVRDHGYTPVIPPFLVGSEAMVGCGQLPKFADGLYHCEADDLYLVPTAESALAGLHRDEVLGTGDLPLRYVGYTPCFRREAGAAGQDTRGILRVHQFGKVELFQFTTAEASYEALEQLVTDAEAVLRALGLPYRVVLLSAGDMGFAAAKTYDLEVWLPGQRTYREISSCSNVEDFQARRSNTRYRPGPQAKPRFAHMLNGSGLAVGRTMIAILENYQQEDGSIVVPPALRPYLWGRERLVPSGRGGRQAQARGR